MRHARLPRSFLLVPALLLLVATAAPAPADEVAKTFDVRDLILQVPDFVDAPKLGVQSGTSSGADAATESPLPTRAELVDGLVGWLHKALKADERPATSISIDEHGKLSLKGEKEAVARLTRLLDGLRQARATQITVEARQIALAGDIADLADGDVATKLLTAMSPGRPAVEMSGADVDALLRTVQASAASSLVTAPRITLFNGQRAYVLVANQRAFVASHGEVMVNGKRTTEPNVEVISTGVVHDVRGTVAQDGRSVALEVKFQWARLLEMREETKAGPEGKALAVQVPVIESFAEDRTVVLPDGNAVLAYLGDAGAPPSGDGKPDAAKDNRPAGGGGGGKGGDAEGAMFLIVRANVVKTEVKPFN